jgi:large subunit ribosomal protein L28
VAFACAICKKGIGRGNKISHAHNVSRRTWKPNLQRVRAVVDGRTKHLRVCTRCLRSNFVQKAPAVRHGRPAQTKASA